MGIKTKWCKNAFFAFYTITIKKRKNRGKPSVFQMCERLYINHFRFFQQPSVAYCTEVMEIVHMPHDWSHD